MPPPIPVTIPSTIAMPGSSPYAIAFEAPETANSASPAASNRSTGFDIRTIMEEK
jgi:hypothetical protein